MRKYYDYKDSEYFVRVERKENPLRADVYIGTIEHGNDKSHTVFLSGGFASYIEHFRSAKDMNIRISKNTLSFRGRDFSY